MSVSLRHQFRDPDVVSAIRTRILKIHAQYKELVAPFQTNLAKVEPVAEKSKQTQDYHTSATQMMAQKVSAVIPKRVSASPVEQPAKRQPTSLTPEKHEESRPSVSYKPEPTISQHTESSQPRDLLTMRVVQPKSKISEIVEQSYLDVKLPSAFSMR